MTTLESNNMISFKGNMQIPLDGNRTIINFNLNKDKSVNVSKGRAKEIWKNVKEVHKKQQIESIYQREVAKGGWHKFFAKVSAYLMSEKFDIGKSEHRKTAVQVFESELKATYNKFSTIEYSEKEIVDQIMNIYEEQQPRLREKMVSGQGFGARENDQHRKEFRDELSKMVSGIGSHKKIEVK